MMRFNKILPLALTAVAAFCTLSVALAQTSVSITASGTQFDPAQVTIQQGDTVYWYNVQGNHSVNGSLSAYPDNPEPFGIATGIGWTYSHVFDIAGVYNYHCDPHVSIGMTGVVVVEVVTDVDDNLDMPTFEIFPVPASSVVTLRFSEATFSTLRAPEIILYDQLGREQSRAKLSSAEKTIDVSRYYPGLYFFQLVDEERVLRTEKLVIQ